MYVLLFQPGDMLDSCLNYDECKPIYACKWYVYKKECNDELFIIFYIWYQNTKKSSSTLRVTGCSNNNYLILLDTPLNIGRKLGVSESLIYSQFMSISISTCQVYNFFSPNSEILNVLKLRKSNFTLNN